MKLPTLLAGCLALLIEHATGAVLNLVPVADTTISENNAARATFDGTTMIVGRLSANNGEALCRSLLRFDLSSLPNDATITSASLTITVLRNHLGDSDTHGLHRVNIPWTEEHATWLTSGLEDWLGGDVEFEPDSTVALPTGTSVFASTPSMIAAVQSWRDAPFNNHGWLLVSGDEVSSGNARRIASRESPGNSPSLTIHYTVPDRFPGPPPGRLANVQLTNSTIRFQFTVLPGTNYLVQSRGAFGGTAWATTTNFPARSTATVATVVHPISATQQFFRVLQAPAGP